VALGGVTERGAGWTYYETVGGGQGGRPTGPGQSGIHTAMTNTRNTPVEAFEPWLSAIDLALCMTVHPGFGGPPAGA